MLTLRDSKNAHSIEHARQGRDVGKDMVRRRHVWTEACLLRTQRQSPDTLRRHD
jgi:hypothetical protein